LGVVVSIKEGPRNLKPDLGTEIGMSHLSVLSQILQTAVYIFGGGGFGVGKERVGQGVVRECRVGGRHLLGPSFTGLSDQGGGKRDFRPLQGPY
jgi:hypothetical protein